MRKKKKNASRASHQSMRVAVVFILSVVFLMLISLTFKTVLLIKQSKYTDDYNFTIGILTPLNKDNTEKKGEVISFDPLKQKITKLSFKEPIKKQEQLASITRVPIDSIVEHKAFDRSNHDIASSLKKLLFNFGTLKTELTIIDAARLFLFAQTVPGQNLRNEEVSRFGSGVSLDSKAASLFTDSRITDEKVTIEIVNGTDVSGLGNKVARMILNIGGNIISVTTARKTVNTSTIQYSQKTYTFERLEKLFDFQAIQKKQTGISDIIITIGEDRAEEFKN